MAASSVRNDRKMAPAITAMCSPEIDSAWNSPLSRKASLVASVMAPRSPVIMALAMAPVSPGKPAVMRAPIAARRRSIPAPTCNAQGAGGASGSATGAARL